MEDVSGAFTNQLLMKRFIFVSLGLICSLFALAQNVGELVLLGDMDNDGKITTEDVSVLSKVIIGKRNSRFIPAKYVTAEAIENGTITISEERHFLGDVNQDGEVSVADVALMVEMLSGREIKRYIAKDIVVDTLGIRNGHEYVDLGLSVKWATSNVGANASSGRGQYFAWGETQSKSKYDWSTYEWMASGQSTWHYISKYTFDDYMISALWYDDNMQFVGDNKYTFDVCDDAVSEAWGAEWRTPTFSELSELKEKCTWRWTSNYNSSGMSGYVITSKVAGFTNKSIFMPAAGYVEGNSLLISGTNGGYWTRELSDAYSFNAYALGFNSQNIYWFEMERCYGFCIRPVIP